MNHNDTHPHLNENIFRDIARYRKSLKKLVSDVENSNEEFIRHLLAKYTELLPPVWAAVELMTMGQLSNWFSNIRHRRDRQDISKGYGLDERIMTSFCEHLSLVRNCAAHHARLWNREFVKTMMLPKNAPQYLQISLNRTPDNEKKLRKLYNTLTMSAYLMDRINPAHQWKVRLAALIESHGVDTSSMGFPKDWAALPVWRDKDKPQ
jgi:abortive infection bacteriophage resistance protein